MYAHNLSKEMKNVGRIVFEKALLVLSLRIPGK
jgi:hypothetical protein